MKRFFLLFTILLLTAQLTISVSAESASPQSLLIGTWHHRNFKQFADEKLVREYDSSDDATVQFTVDGTWIMSSARFQSSGTYKWLDNKRIETKIIQSNFPAQIGTIKDKEIQVKQQTLQMTIIYNEAEIPMSADGAHPKKMVTISTFDRLAGK